MHRTVGILGGALAGFLLPAMSSQAQTASVRTAAWPLYAAVAPGKTETVSVQLRDHHGHPVAHTRGTATVRLGSRVASYPIPATHRDGTTRLTFTVSKSAPAASASVHLVFRSGASTYNLNTSFHVLADVVSAAFTISARVLPQHVTPPAPVWVLVYARTRSGQVAANLPVRAAIVFQHRTVHLRGVTGPDGVATLPIDTSHSRQAQTVAVGVVAYHGAQSASITSQFSLSAAPAPTAVPTDTPSPTATATAAPTATPTATAIPTVLPAPTATVVVTQTATPTPTPTPIFTDTPTAAPTATPTPTLPPTDTPVPTDTPTPTVTPAPTHTPTPIPPTPTATVPGSCSGNDCLQYTVDVLNNDRAQYGLSPLSLDLTQSIGSGSCRGAYGHSVDMATQGGLFHDDLSTEFCTMHHMMEQNVGYWPSYQGVPTAIRGMDQLMMNEPHDPQTCAAQINHACNILSPLVSHVGVGIYIDPSGTVWLTEDLWG